MRFTQTSTLQVQAWFLKIILVWFCYRHTNLRNPPGVTHLTPVVVHLSPVGFSGQVIVVKLRQELFSGVTPAFASERQSRSNSQVVVIGVEVAPATGAVEPVGAVATAQTEAPDVVAVITDPAGHDPAASVGKLAVFVSVSSPLFAWSLGVESCALLLDIPELLAPTIDRGTPPCSTLHPIPKTNANKTLALICICPPKKIAIKPLRAPIDFSP